ncbi:hypothetical protein ACOI1C_02495 [Bacillus sp. DJP31]|uniref:hypothetical protein n=1 Tax=Bacillus sp. DJP31 TaxID=3409789 RepID=UPI003BB6EB5E
MKYIIGIIVSLVLLTVIGYGVYQVGTGYVADQVIAQVYAELENSGEIDLILEEVKNNPELQQFLEDETLSNAENLPFNTKEEATKVLLKKFTLSEIKDMQSMISNGLTSKEEAELLLTVQSKLTEEELLALKVITIKDMYQ